MAIVQTFNEIWEPIFTTKARYKFLFGGRARGGSHTATDYFLHLQTQPHYFRGYFMREVFGDVRNSLWQDYKDRIADNETLDERLFGLNETALTSTYYPTGNNIVSKGFKKSSGKQTAKLKSIAGATHVCIEELEEIDEMDFNQLDSSLRTTKGDIEIVGIFNPPHKNHWLIRNFYNLMPAEDVHGPDFKGYYIAQPKQIDNFLSIHATYLDNLDNVNETTQNIFERYRETNFEYYATMIKGLVSEGAKGVIFKTWKPITYAEFKALPYDSFFGLDFGFSNDPAAIVEVKAHNDNIWIHEVVYKRGLTNPDIKKEFEANKITTKDEIYADSAEPKSIEELKPYKVIPSVKGADSIRAGIQYLLSKKVHYTENSTNLIMEKDNYTYALDSNKEPTDKPVDKYNHCFVGTTAIQTIEGPRPMKYIKEGDMVLTSQGYKKVLIKWDNGAHPVYKYRMQFDTFGVTLVCTPNHLIKTDKGWAPISELQSGMTVYLNNFSTAGDISSILRNDTFPAQTEECTLMYGNTLMVNRPKATMCITRMKTRGITALKTWNLKNQGSTYQTTTKTGILRNSSKRGQKGLLSGTSPKRGYNGIQNMAKEHGKIESGLNVNANNAAIHTYLTIPKEASFAIKTVKLKRLEVGEETIRQVYDLTVEDAHEYFANGVLVHNCMDALRYSVYTKFAVPKKALTWLNPATGLVETI